MVGSDLLWSEDLNMLQDRHYDEYPCTEYMNLCYSIHRRSYRWINNIKIALTYLP